MTSVNPSYTGQTRHLQSSPSPHHRPRSVRDRTHFAYQHPEGRVWLALSNGIGLTFVEGSLRKFTLRLTARVSANRGGGTERRGVMTPVRRTTSSPTDRRNSRP